MSNIALNDQIAARLRDGRRYSEGEVPSCSYSVAQKCLQGKIIYGEVFAKYEPFNEGYENFRTCPHLVHEDGLDPCNVMLQIPDLLLCDLCYGIYRDRHAELNICVPSFMRVCEICYAPQEQYTRLFRVYDQLITVHAFSCNYCFGELSKCL